MLKSVATVLVIIAVVGAEAKQTGEKSSNAIPVLGASKDNLSPDSKTTPLNVLSPQHQPANAEEEKQLSKEGSTNTNGNVADLKTEDASEKLSTSAASASESMGPESNIKLQLEVKPIEEKVENSEETKTLKKKIEDDKGSESHVKLQLEVKPIEAKVENSEETKKLKKKIEDDKVGGEKRLSKVGSTNINVNVANMKTEDASEKLSSSAASATESKGSESNIKLQLEVKPDEENIESSEETKALKNKIKDDTGLEGNHWHVSTHCLNCLCQILGCDFNILQRGCQGNACGPFGITYVFWEDAFDHKLPDGPSFEDDASMQNKWKLCSLDLTCSTKTIQLYFQKYPHDCNGDGKVDCLDYAAIHTLGPYGCMEKKKLDSWNQKRRKGLLECLARKEDGAYIKKMHELENEVKPLDAEVMTV